MMKRSYFRKRLESHVLLVESPLAGPLRRAGIPEGVPAERANVDHPDLVRDVHRRHLNAGIDVLVTNTLRAGEDHLRQSGTAADLDRVNRRGALLAGEVAQGRVVVAGAIGSPVERIEPLGRLGFSSAVSMFQRQAKPLLEGNVDLFLIGPMSELKEARAAVIAVRELCDLPITVFMAFGEGGVSETGTDPLTFFTVVEALDVDALGLSWHGPWDECRKPLAAIRARTGLPLIVQMVEDDAGEGEGGRASGEELGAWAADAVAHGARMLRRSDWWEHEQVAAVAGAVAGAVPRGGEADLRMSRVSSRTKTVEIGDELPIRIIGERINPTARPRLITSIQEGERGAIEEEAAKQVTKGASILDVNVGVPGVDEQEAMRWAVRAVGRVADVPLAIDSADPLVIEAGLAEAPGKSIVNSVTGEEKSLERMLPLVKRYGAAMIGMAIDEKGLPDTAESRLAIAERIVAQALDTGVSLRDIFIDCVTLTVGAAQDQAWETLRAIGMVKERLGARTVLGVSNISHGMPQRGVLNRAFLAMALGYGLDLPIVNPYAKGVDEVVAAADVLLGRDKMGLSFIEQFGKQGA